MSVLDDLICPKAKMLEITVARTNQDWQGYNGAYTIQRKRAMQVGPDNGGVF